MKAGPVTGLRVMVVEDDMIIGGDIAAQVSELGFEVVGPFPRAEMAFDLVEQDSPDMAILDFNLGRDRTSKAIADRLSALGVPFCFISGYAAADVAVRAGSADVICLPKPLSTEALPSMLSQLADRWRATMDHPAMPVRAAV